MLVVIVRAKNNVLNYSRNTPLFVCVLFVISLFPFNTAFSATTLTELRGEHSGTAPSGGGVQLKRAMSTPVWFGDDESFSDWDIRLAYPSYRSTSVALGDVNNDGRLDVLSNDGSRLYLHYGQENTVGQWSYPDFYYRATYVRAWPYTRVGMALGDLDGDGRLDYVSTDASGYTVAFKLTGFSSLRPAWAYTDFPLLPAGSPGTDADRRKPALVDLDGDGDLDLIIGLASSASLAPGFQQFENTGTPQTPVWTAFDASIDRWNLNQVSNSYTSGTVQLSFGDLDGDGDPDLMSSNGCVDADCGVHFFRNDWDGVTNAWTLMPAWEMALRAGLTPYLADTLGFKLGDVDADGDLDVIYLGTPGYEVPRAIRNDATVSFSTSVPGTFTSRVIDISADNVAYTAINYDAYVPIGTALSIKVRSGNTALPDAGWSDWNLSDLASGADISAQVGSDQYLQYKVDLTTSNSDISPFVGNIVFTFSLDPPPPAVFDVAGSFAQTSWAASGPVCNPSDTNVMWDCNANVDENQTGWVGFTPVVNPRVDVSEGNSLKLFPSIGSSVDSLNSPSGQASGAHSLTMAAKEGVQLLSSTSDPLWFGDDEWVNVLSQWTRSSRFSRSRIIAMGDVNNDGFSDALLLTPSRPTDSSLYFSNGAIGGWSQYYNVGSLGLAFSQAAGITLGDLNGDGLLDAMGVTSSGAVVTFEMDRISSTGVPTWVESAWDAPTGGSPGVDADRRVPTLVDLDQDGDLDLIISLASSVANSPGYQQFENIGNSAAPVWQAFDSLVDRWNLESVANTYTEGIPQLSFADIDGDGDPDLMASSTCADMNCVNFFRNDGGGAAWTLMDGTDPSASADWGTALRPDTIYYQVSNAPYFRVGDIDGDGDNDILFVDDRNSSLRAVRNDTVRAFSPAGTFTSKVVDTNGHDGFLTVDYNETVPTNTTLTIRIRAGDTPVPDLSWSVWSTRSNGADISDLGKARYVQYEAQLTTADSSITPSLRRVSFNHTVYPATAVTTREQDKAIFTSSFFNTKGINSTIDSMVWNESLTSPDQDIRVQIRTIFGTGGAGTGDERGSRFITSYSNWMGPDGTPNTYWNSKNDFGGICSKVGQEVTCAFMPLVIRDGNSDQWFHYKIEFVSAGGETTPILFDIKVNFTRRKPANIAPVIHNLTSSSWAMNTDENREFRFEVRVTDMNEDKVRLSLSGGDDRFAFSLDDGTLQTVFERPWLTSSNFGIVLTDVQDFEFPTDGGGDNTYILELTATELGVDGLSSTQVLTLTVNDVNESPFITNPLPSGDGSSAASNESIAYLTVDENTTFVTTVTSNDLDSAASVSYRISGGADRSKFTINLSTGEVRFITAPDYEVPTDFGTNNQYDVQVSAVDGDAPYRIKLQNIVVMVNDVSDSLSSGVDVVSSGTDTTSSAAFLVTSNLDAVDQAIGDGICASDLSGNPCTLRAAIQEANALTNSFADGIELPDEITFVDQTTPVIYEITLLGESEDLSETGDFDISESLNIVGNLTDMNQIVIDAKGRDRVFHVLPTTRGSTVEFRYLSITGGKLSDQREGGAGICIDCGANDSASYEPLTDGRLIGDITTDFTPTVSTSQPGQGGFALPLRPVVKFQNVDLYSNNGAGVGSGIMNAGVLTIDNSVIRNNGMLFFGAGLSLQGGNFAASDGGGFGGGIANWGGKLTIRNSILSGNGASTGGAIYSQPILAQFRDEQVIIERSQLTGNLGFMGGAIFNVSGVWDFPARELMGYGLTIDLSTLDNNAASFLGGAIYSVGLSAIKISNTTLSNNVASSVGRRIGNLANKGGAIFHGGKILDIDNSNFTGNNSKVGFFQGGGLPLDYQNEITGGDDIFLDTTSANQDPESTLPWRFSLLNSIVGTTEASDQSDACFGSVGFRAFITDIGGNTDDSATCISSSAPVIKPSVRRKVNSRALRKSESTILGLLANNGGIPGNELPDGTFPPTHALLAGSAIGAGIDCGGQDQRGFGRDSDSCDSGAFQTNGNSKGVTSNDNRDPIARDDYFVVPASERLTLRLSKLLANDNDPQQRGAVLFDKNSVQLLDQNGSMVSVGEGEGLGTSSIDFLYFTPALDYVGTTRFTYTVSVVDPSTSEPIYSEPGIVTIETTDKNLQPVAYSQSFFLVPGETKSSNLYGELSNYKKTMAFDPEQSELQYFVDLKPQFGELEINPDGTFFYTADVDAEDSDGFTYTVKDASGMRSQSATVTIDFIVSDVSGMVSPNVSVSAGKIIRVDLRGGMPGDLSFSLSRDLVATQGRVIWLNQQSGELLYRANENAGGEDRFGFSVIDKQTTADPDQAKVFSGFVEVSILETTENIAPVADAYVFDALLEQPNSFYVLASDDEADLLIYAVDDAPEKGDVAIIDPSAGLLLYTPSPYATGVDSFTYRASDGLDESLPAQVTINLIEVYREPPVANDDSALTPNDMSISVNVLKNDTVVNGGKLSVILDSSSSEQGGRVSVSRKGIVRYIPPANYIGEDIVTYQVDDGYAKTDSARLKVTVIEASFNNYQTEIGESEGNANSAENTGNGLGYQAYNDDKGGSLLWLLLLGFPLIVRRHYL